MQVRRFAELTHVGKGRRLRPFAMDLLRTQFGVRAVALHQVAETINIVYRVRIADGRRFVLRLTPPTHFHDRQDVLSELAWLRALRDDEIGVPVAIPAGSGMDVVSASWNGIPGTWHVVLFSWIRGANLAARWTAKNIERYGQLAARLHVAGGRFAPPKGFRVRTAATVFPHCNPAFARPEPLILFDNLPTKLLPPARRALFRHAHDVAQAEITQLFENGIAQPIHNDLHPWNVMISREEIYAIDFENLLLGFPIQDLGTTINYLRDYVKDNVPFEERLASFRAGYESVRPWPEAFPGQIRLLTASHRLLLCNYYAAHHDPEFRAFAYDVFEIVERRLQEDLAAAGKPLGKAR